MAGQPFSPIQARALRRKSQARNYNRWLHERNEPHLGDRVLDVGAGIGTLTELIVPGRELVVACEPDPDLAPALRERFAGVRAVRVVDSDATELDAGTLGTRFDSILCSNVLEHIEDDEEALRRMRGVLVPGGQLLLLVPAHPFLYGSMDRRLHHVRRYRRAELRRLLERTGFSVAELRYVNPVGALGWLVSGRVLRRSEVPTGAQQLYDRLVPLLRALDRIELPFGLSLWARAARPATRA
jgi:SAM-dependent methyltransferase